MIWVSFSQEAVSPLSYCGVWTRELGFRGAFVVRLYQSVQLDFGYDSILTYVPAVFHLYKFVLSDHTAEE